MDVVEQLGLLVAEDDGDPSNADNKQNHNEHSPNNQQLSFRCPSSESSPDINCEDCGGRIKNRSEGRHESSHHDRQHQTSQPYNPSMPVLS